MNETKPRMQLLSFHGWDDFYGVWSWLLSSPNASSHRVWESETFGDWWEAHFLLTSHHLPLFKGIWKPRILFDPIDGMRGLRLGETFRAVQKERMSNDEQQARREQIASGALQLQIGVSDEELKKAVRELVRCADAVPMHETRPSQEQEDMREERARGTKIFKVEPFPFPGKIFAFDMKTGEAAVSFTVLGAIKALRDRVPDARIWVATDHEYITSTKNFNSV